MIPPLSAVRRAGPARSWCSRVPGGRQGEPAKRDGRFRSWRRRPQEPEGRSWPSPAIGSRGRCPRCREASDQGGPGYHTTRWALGRHERRNITPEPAPRCTAVREVADRSDQARRRGRGRAGYRCTHLRCVVAFDDAEQAWKRPCHGSRFAREGRIRQGPAIRPVERRDI
ncbi:Rieske 2Fe-2S domain-containing protein [Streptomyces sp. 142MFCol3.1]|uniref:Rieske 2Fe-2S domain-containing protein n=1 Tax=Streptomyces sp. 142MFCol3.1 TaxID=1172179 RepID=UPI000995E537